MPDIIDLPRPRPRPQDFGLV